MSEFSDDYFEDDWVGGEIDRDSSMVERPRGRIRMRPEIQATPYSRHIPAEPYKISRAHYAAEWIRYALHNRPSLFELQLELMWRIPIVVVLGSVAVATADNILGLGIAREMAEVKVNSDANGFHQLVQEVVHELGVQAGGAK